MRRRCPDTKYRKQPHAKQNGGPARGTQAACARSTLAAKAPKWPHWTSPQFLTNRPEAPAVSSRGAACGVDRGIAGGHRTESLIVGFQFGYGAMFPFPGLRQKGTAVNRPEGRGLAVQRRDGAVPANVFHDGQAAHVRISPSFPGTNLRHNDFRFVSGARRENLWFPNR